MFSNRFYRNKILYLYGIILNFVLRKFYFDSFYRSVLFLEKNFLIQDNGKNKIREEGRYRLGKIYRLIIVSFFLYKIFEIIFE